MQYAIELFFDEEMEKKLSVMPKELQRKNSAPNILNGKQDLTLR